MHENEKVVHTTMDGSSYDCIVVGCDIDIGVTIVDEEDPAHIVFCIRNPHVYYAMFKEEMLEDIGEDSIEAWLEENTEYFNFEFDRLLSGIKTGKTSSGASCYSPTGGISKSSCPFNG